MDLKNVYTKRESFNSPYPGIILNLKTRDRGPPSSGSLPTNAHNRQSQELGIQSGSPMQVAELQFPEPTSPASSQGMN